MKKELEFEITDEKILTVSDFDWYIDRIDAIYIRHSVVGKRCEYAIFIQQGGEIDELYFRTPDEMIIAREYKKLCNAIKKINPKFDNSVQPFVLINYANLQRVEAGKNKRFLEYIISLQFKNSHLNLNGNQKEYNKIWEKLNSVNDTNITF